MPTGWRIEHRERFVYRANSGNPQIALKVFTYPEYRQKVRVLQLPPGFKTKKKGHNAFLVFRGKVASKGSISLDRTVEVFPEERRIDIRKGIGRISDMEPEMVQKYREASRFWPLKSDIRPEGEWFGKDDLSEWLVSAWKYLRQRIEPENQERRWGAEEALKRGIGDCDEFTDSFITLARMRGIPARRITGIFVRSPDDYERHAWAEAFSPEKGWFTADIALNNIGSHTLNYIVLKVEEFNPAIQDYQASINHPSRVHSRWEIGDMKIYPL